MKLLFVLAEKKIFELETFEKTEFFAPVLIVILVLRKVGVTESADFRSLHKRYCLHNSLMQEKLEI